MVSPWVILGWIVCVILALLVVAIGLALLIAAWKGLVGMIRRPPRRTVTREVFRGHNRE